MPVATTTQAGREVLTPEAERILNQREAARKRVNAAMDATRTAPMIPDRARRAATALNAPQDAPLFSEPTPAKPTAPAEKQANITIEVAPDGLHIRAEYTGTLASIPQAIERLKAAGVLDLVAASRAITPPAGPKRAKAERVTPAYDSDGSPCCPVHRRKLSDGVAGLFCSAQAKDGQVADKKGYCGLKFED